MSTESKKTKQVPRRLHVYKNMYTVLGNYEFADDKIKFHGHKGYNLIGRKLVKDVVVNLKDIKWFEYSSLEGVSSMRSLNSEVQNHLYCKWFSVHGDTSKDVEGYIAWSEYYRKERDKLLKK